MSDNNQDNNDKEIIESEVESIDEVKDETPAEYDAGIDQGLPSEPIKETVVVKKGSFLSFLALLFALAALGLSAYMYYLNHYKTQNTSKISAWQQPIDAVDGKIQDLKQEITVLKQHNKKLGNQVTELSVKTEKIQILAQVEPSVKANPTATNLPEQATQVLEKYDDAVLKAQLAEIQAKLSQPTTQTVEKYDDKEIRKQITQIETQLTQATETNMALQKQVKENNEKNKQTLKSLKKDIETKQLATSQQFIDTLDTLQTSVVAQSLIKQAYIQLNINSNKKKSVKYLNKTQTELQKLSNPAYDQVISELGEITKTITTAVTLDENKTTTKLQQLAQAAKMLTFAKTVTVENEDAAWYEKLVVIKKIDDSQEKSQSKSEQLTIKSDLNGKFTLLKIALMSKDQAQWNEEITSINSLLKQHFEADSQSIQSELSKLQKSKLNPQFPDLEKYEKLLKDIDISLGS